MVKDHLNFVLIEVNQVDELDREQIDQVVGELLDFLKTYRFCRVSLQIEVGQVAHSLEDHSLIYQVRAELVSVE